MGWLSKFSMRSLANQWLPNFVGVFSNYSETGVPVTHENALTVSAIWSALSILSDSLAGLPFSVIDEKNDKQVDHALARVLGNDGEANEFMSAVTFKAALMANIGLWGNGYAVIERDLSGNPIALYPLPSGLTTPRRTNGFLFYQTTIGTKTHTLNPADVLHILGPLTLDGLVGLNPIMYARSTVGLSLALERFAAKFFGQGGNIGGIIEVPAMKPDALKNFIDTWKQTYTGPDSAFKVAALTGGMKFHRTTADPKESQSVESRVHQIREVARIWRIPPHMLGDLEKASYKSIEQQNMEFYQGTMHPHVVRWESEISRKLLLESEKRRLRVCLNMDAKLRGDTTERYASYNVGRQGGWLCVNDIRKQENLPPIEGGDTYLQPLNMTTAGSADAADGLQKVIDAKKEKANQANSQTGGKGDE